MWRGFLAMALVVGLLTAAGGQESKTDKKAEGQATEKSAADKLRDNPNDLQALTAYLNETIQQILESSRTKPDEAQKKLDAAKEVIDKVAAVAEGAVKLQLDRVNRTLTALQRQIDSSRKLVELIGKDAAPLKVETWVNGSPLSDADLKGKVVLLDFWAVWCGPCIATFPHLREWNEKYGDKGLVIIGLTGYYNFKWDEEAKKATRSADEVKHSDEQAMLVKFAESHDLKHRFAIQADDSLSEYYGVTGIPHVVVIDQQGKIRLMRVGSGDQNAHDIGDMLDKLLAANKTGG
jgi:thiol-disulfide isomerase/thioredoxin